MKRNVSDRKFGEEPYLKRPKSNVDRGKPLDTSFPGTIEKETNISSLDLALSAPDIFSIILKMLDPVFAYSFKLISKRYFEVIGKFLSDPTFSIEAVLTRRCAYCGNSFGEHRCELNNVVDDFDRYRRRDVELLLNMKGYDEREIRKIMTCEPSKPTTVIYVRSKGFVDLQKYDVPEGVVSINGERFLRYDTMVCEKISFCHYGSKWNRTGERKMNAKITLRESIYPTWNDIGRLDLTFIGRSNRIAIDYYADAGNDETSYFRYVRSAEIRGNAKDSNPLLRDYGIENFNLTWARK
jgi:hypothetical protein